MRLMRITLFTPYIFKRIVRAFLIIHSCHPLVRDAPADAGGPLEVCVGMVAAQGLSSREALKRASEVFGIGVYRSLHEQCMVCISVTW